MNIIDRRKKLTNILEPMGKKITATQLITEGFCEAPASRTHHGNYEGGLLDHSIEVAEILKKLTKSNGLIWEREESPEIIGLCHDLCKMDEYTKSLKYIAGTEIADPDGTSRKLENDEYDYTWNENQLLTGHGEKSCIKALQTMALTDEEIMCIRYHMGAFEGEQIFKSYTAAVKKYPNILFVHLADMIASQINEI